MFYIQVFYRQVALPIDEDIIPTCRCQSLNSTVFYNLFNKVIYLYYGQT